MFLALNLRLPASEHGNDLIPRHPHLLVHHIVCPDISDLGCRTKFTEIMSASSEFLSVHKHPAYPPESTPAALLSFQSWKHIISFSDKSDLSQRKKQIFVTKMSEYPSYFSFFYSNFSFFYQVFLDFWQNILFIRSLHYLYFCLHDHQ